MKSSLYLGPKRRKPGLREKLFDDVAPVGCFNGCTALSEQSAVIMVCIVCSRCQWVALAEGSVP